VRVRVFLSFMDEFSNALLAIMILSLWLGTRVNLKLVAYDVEGMKSRVSIKLLTSVRLLTRK
jgi:hypothetical protein